MMVALSPDESWWIAWQSVWGWIGTMNLVRMIDWRRPRLMEDRWYESEYYQLLGKQLKDLYHIHEDTLYVRRPNGELMYHSTGSYKRYLEMGDEAWQAQWDAMLHPKFEEVRVTINPYPKRGRR